MNNSLTRFERIRIVLVALLFINTPRTESFNCWAFVRHVFRLARIKECKYFKNISKKEAENPPFGEVIFLLEKGVRNKRWSHVVITLPFGYVVHMSYYWGMKVTITPLSEIWDLYNLSI